MVWDLMVQLPLSLGLVGLELPGCQEWGFMAGAAFPNLGGGFKYTPVI